MVPPRYLLGMFSFSVSALILFNHNLSYASDGFESSLLETCPIDSSIRVADRQAIERYTALEGCAAHIVVAPTAPLQPSEGIVRIIGVDDAPLKKRQRENRRRAAERQTVAMTIPAYNREVRLAASRHRIDPLLLHAIIDTESGYRPAVTSSAGAVGLMQIMPGTGADLGIDRKGLVDPARNIDAGARHLKRLQNRFGPDFKLILSAYNAGAGAVARYGNRVPPYRETRDYVGKVLGKYHRLRASVDRTW